MQNLGIFVTTALSICGGITIITGTIIGVSNVTDKITKNRKERDRDTESVIKEHTKEIAELKESTEGIKKDVIETKEMTKLICQGVKCLMDNAITGNGIENLKKSRKELDDFLINK